MAPKPLATKSRPAPSTARATGCVSPVAGPTGAPRAVRGPRRVRRGAASPWAPAAKLATLSALKLHTWIKAGLDGAAPRGAAAPARSGMLHRGAEEVVRRITAR